MEVLQGRFSASTGERREILLDGGQYSRNQAKKFGNLVHALGSVTDLAHVPGLAEHGLPMKNVGDALRLRVALINRLEEANLVDDPEARRRLLTFVVAGGGYTGVETAGQLFDFLCQARRFYDKLRRAKLRMVLVHAGPRLLPEIGPALGGYAQKVLKRRGVEVKVNTKVVRVTAHHVTFEDGVTLEANTVITTIGAAPNPVVVDLCHALGLDAPKGRIRVDPTMRVPGHENLWAMGDCALVPWSDRGVDKTSPPTAQFAVRQGKQLAANLIRVLRGEAPRPFRFRYLGQLAAIGQHDAVAEILGLHFRGWLAWWLWRTIYLAKLPGIRRRLRVMIDWTFDLIFPRDISILVPTAEADARKHPRPD